MTPCSHCKKMRHWGLKCFMKNNKIKSTANTISTSHDNRKSK